MKLLIVLLSIMITSQALATGGKNEPNNNNSSVSNASAGSVSGSSSNSVSANKSTQAVKNVASGGQAASKSLAQGGAGGHSASRGGDAEGGNSQVEIEGDTVRYTYKQPPLALAGKADTIIIGCREVFGFDFRGAGNDAAGGATFGVPHTNERCKLDEAIAEAFASDDLELGWGLWCSQKEVWKGIQNIERAVYNNRIDKHSAIKLCFNRKRTPDKPEKPEESYQERILLKQCDEEKGELLDRVTKECGTVRK